MILYLLFPVPSQFMALSRDDSKLEFVYADTSFPRSVSGMKSLDDVSATQLDYDASSQEIIWTDAKKGVISVDKLQGNHRRDLAKGFTTELTAIAVDWVSRLLYFSDQEEKILGVARLDGRYIKILRENVRVSSIALDPENG